LLRQLNHNLTDQSEIQTIKTVVNLVFTILFSSFKPIKLALNFFLFSFQILNQLFWIIPQIS